MKSKLSRLIFFAALLIGAWCWWQYHREHRYDKEILAAARRYKVSPALVRAVVWQESRFDADVRGSVGEIGLMQVRFTTATEWAAAENIHQFRERYLYDPDTNTRAGAWYLAKLLKRYRNTDNPLPYALADYNAGRGNVLKWLKGTAATNSAAFIEQIGFPSTRAYVRNVMQQQENYQSMYK